jgi:hypothetical protein
VSEFRIIDCGGWTDIAKNTFRALRFSRLADASAVGNKKMWKEDPISFWYELDQVLFDLVRVLVFC